MESDKAIVVMIMQGSSQELRASRFPRGHRRRGDSDSEDDDFTSDHTSGPDYDSAGDEVNDRILQALERLHQDMKSVLRRLSSMEEAVMSRQVGSQKIYCSMCFLTLFLKFHSVNTVNITTSLS